MTCEQHWQYVTKNNPTFLTDDNRLSAVGLKHFHDATWDEAIREGTRRAAQITGAELPDVLKDLFGGVK